MELENFYDLVDDRLMEGVAVEPDEATNAVLTALATCLGHDEAMELGAALPEALGDVLATAAGDRPFDRDDFIEDVAARLDVDDVDAERVTLAVLGALRGTLESHAAVEEVIESLPSGLAHLMQNPE